MIEINVAMQKVIDELMEVNGLLETSLANATDEIEHLTAVVVIAIEVIQHGVDLMPVNEYLQWGDARVFLDFVRWKEDE